MREIKFRAWDKEAKEMGEPFTLEDAINDSAYNPNDVELMQYIGLKDTNGKEIYEGDVIDHLYFKARGVATWQQARVAFVIRYLDGEFDMLLGIDAEHYKVVGNKYQNPELLK